MRLRNITGYSLLLILLTGCAIPIKIITEEIPRTKKEYVTENQVIADKFDKERRLLWLAFQRAKIKKWWDDDFMIASAINNFYDFTDNPSREKFYDEIRREMTGYSEITPVTKRLKKIGNNYIIEEIPAKSVQKFGLRSDIVDKLLDEAEYHYQFLEKLGDEYIKLYFNITNGRKDEPKP